ncbi:MAG: malate dehydrogenase [Phycisphaerales bacterium]|nr:malate dehydrogenase [Phycisphaerales bacterium]
MKRAKISIIGIGHVGSACALLAVQQRLGDVVLVDIPALDGLPQGRALDLYEATPLIGTDARIIGTTNYEDVQGSDLVILTAGVVRKPGMSRDDLLSINAGIIKTIATNVAQAAPQAILIVVSNPLDAMVYAAWQASGFAPQRVIGQAGVLDTSRYRAFVAQAVGCSVNDVQALLLGGHGDDMVPLKRYTYAGGIPITQLLDHQKLDEIIDRTRKGGAEIVRLLKTSSAAYTPAAATIEMARAILHDQKRILPCAAYCDQEYGIGGYFVGVPCVLGSAGVERVLQVELDDAEQQAFDGSVEHVRSLVAALKKMS